MGEQIKLIDLARNMIRLSGFIPDEEIPVSVIGLRPGEKLREELVGSDEILIASKVEKILRVESTAIPDLKFVVERIAELERLVTDGRWEPLIDWLSEMVPTFRSTHSEVWRQASYQRAKKQNTAKVLRMAGSPR
jgi:FlaA1/EpsC-like NDP-sugar epimerase